MTHAFRIRVVRAPGDTVNADAPTLDLPSLAAGESVTLKALPSGTSVKAAKALVVVGSGFPSEAEAIVNGERYSRALLRTLAHLRIGCDFGGRSPSGVVTTVGLKWLEDQAQQRVLNDVHGLMVFDSEPWPKFASIHADAVRGVPRERFERVLLVNLQADSAVSPRERVAFDLFNASYFQPSVDAILVLRMMAVEALLEPSLRVASALRHVDQLIAATQAEKSLEQDEQESLLGSLGWLRKDSIGRTGRRFAEARLPGRKYLEMPPGQFFAECYSLRSRLVHADHAFPSRNEVTRVAGGLELFVSDLLAGPAIDVQ